MKTFLEFLNESKGEPVSRIKALEICKDLCEKLNLKLIEDIGPDTKGEPNCAYIGGSVRRKVEIVNDVDILVTKILSPEELLMKIPELTIDKSGSKQIFIFYKNISINLWILDNLSQFGSFIFHITGPKGYNIGIRMLASKIGCKLNQYGLFKNDDDDDDELVEGSNETEGGLYKSIKYEKYPDGKPWKAPELRGK